MQPLFTNLDLVIFFGSLLAVMAVGLWAGRKEESSEDFYLAGKGTKWWGVAGSIFGSNVSANHIMGMMGVGYMYGFAQSHFEITAIAGLLLLCYAFLPVYRKLNVYTLSEYLSRRYNDSCRLIYALIMIVIMVIIQMVPGFYIGSRSLNDLILDYGDTAQVTAEVNEDGTISDLKIVNGGVGYAAAPTIEVTSPKEQGENFEAVQATAVLGDGVLTGINVTSGGSGYDVENPPAVQVQEEDVLEQTSVARAVVNSEGRVVQVRIERAGQGFSNKPMITIDAPPSGAEPAKAVSVIADGVIVAVNVDKAGAGYSQEAPPKVTLKGGASFAPEKYAPGDVDPKWYTIGIIIMALVTGTYTIFGGLKAVIVTDVIQSVLVLIAGITVACFTFYHPDIGGWAAMVSMDQAVPAAQQKLHLYNPSTHPQLPWTGVLSGLMIIHVYYWGANQFIVQRALSAESDKEAKFGIIAAGFFKLMIPFFSIGTGIAAFYLFGEGAVAQDVVFLELLKRFIAPIGFGLTGLIAAGIVGAILSSIDSMMNSAATIVTFDIYKRYINPDADEEKLVWIGRLCIVGFIILAAALTIFSMNPNSKDSFFLQIASHQGRLIAGVVVAFVLGMLWKRATAAGAVVALVSGVVLSYTIPSIYPAISESFGLEPVFGQQLNFFHTAFIAAVISCHLHVIVSLLTKPDEEKAKLTWSGMGVFDENQVLGGVFVLIVSVEVYVMLAVCMWADILAVGDYRSATVAAGIGGIYTFLVFLVMSALSNRRENLNAAKSQPRSTLLNNDRTYAGLLAGLAIFMMYYFY